MTEPSTDQSMAQQQPPPRPAMDPFAQVCGSFNEDMKDARLADANRDRASRGLAPLRSLTDDAQDTAEF